MKIRRVENTTTVPTHYTESTDRQETEKRRGEAERMAKGKARWGLNGRRTDTDKGDDK